MTVCRSRTKHGAPFHEQLKMCCWSAAGQLLLLQLEHCKSDAIQHSVNIGCCLCGSKVNCMGADHRQQAHVAARDAVALQANAHGTSTRACRSWCCLVVLVYSVCQIRHTQFWSGIQGLQRSLVSCQLRVSLKPARRDT